jgi:dTDP-4-amino-4,6-dideoxygalactose transaminase
VAANYLVNTQHLIQGPAIPIYEQAFAQRIGVRYASSFSAGRVAFYGILQALGVGPGDEVLLQVPTHIVIPTVIRAIGARPVYVDCSLDTYNMDLDQVESCISPRSKVLLIQHTFGIPANLDQAVDLANRHGLALVEDCVHALGATYDGQPVGSFGRAAFFSTEETKTITSTMGGMAVTNDPALARGILDFQSQCRWPAPDLISRYMMKILMYTGFTHPYVHTFTRPIYMGLRTNPRTHLAPGATSQSETHGILPKDFRQRLSNAQAEIALRQLHRLDQNLAHRAAMAKLYETSLSKFGFNLPHPSQKSHPGYVRYPVWVEDRAAAIAGTKSRVVLGMWFNSVLEEAASWSSGDYQAGSCPRAESAAIHLVNLPTHPRVTPRDAEAIVDALVRAS